MIQHLQPYFRRFWGERVAVALVLFIQYKSYQFLIFLCVVLAAMLVATISCFRCLQYKVCVLMSVSGYVNCFVALEVLVSNSIVLYLCESVLCSLKWEIERKQILDINLLKSSRPNNQPTVIPSPKPTKSSNFDTCDCT